MSNKSVLVLNGPGLADLSSFDGNEYGGGITLEKINQACVDLCDSLGIRLEFRQTDDEEEMFRFVARDSEDFDGLIINPVGYSRAASVEFEMYRTAILTIAHLKKPVIEIHITNIFKPGAEVTKPLQVPGEDIGFISGLGVHSYLMAIRAIYHRLSEA